MERKDIRAQLEAAAASDDPRVVLDAALDEIVRLAKADEPEPYIEIDGIGNRTGAAQMLTRTQAEARNFAAERYGKAERWHAVQDGISHKEAFEVLFGWGVYGNAEGLKAGTALEASGATTVELLAGLAWHFAEIMDDPEGRWAADLQGAESAEGLFNSAKEARDILIKAAVTLAELGFAAS